MRSAAIFARLNFHYQKTYNVTAYSTNIDNLDVVVTAVPIFLLKSLTNPVGNVMGKSFDIETQLCY